MAPRNTTSERMAAAGWEALPRGYLPAAEVRRIEKTMERYAAEADRIATEKRKPGRPRKS